MRWEKKEGYSLQHIAEEGKKHVVRGVCLQVFRWRSEGERVPRLLPISEFEEVYEVLRRDGGEAAVRIVGRAGMSRVVPEEDATVPTELQSVPVLLFLWVVFLKCEKHQLPVHMALL